MRIRLLSIGLFTLLVASQADAQSQNDSVLNNAQGATPCDMLQTFPSHCENPQTRDDNDNDTTQAPTACTCTNVYFNLWSACAFTKTPADLPSCDTFQKNCSQALINVTTLQQNNTPYPNWAFVELPANDTFDIVAAIASAEGLPSHKWTVIQIVLPIVVGIVSAVIVLLGVVFYRRRKNKNRGQRDWMQTIGNRPRFNFPTFSSLQRVRELDRSNSWSIDDRQEDLQEYQFVSYPASLQGSRVSGHVRLSSSSSGTSLPPPLQIPEKRPPVRTWPGKSIWKRPLRSARELSDSMPRPWRKAVGVKNIPGYKSFRVDAEDSDSPLSQHPHTQSLLGYSGRSRSNLHRETIFEQEPDEPEDDVESDDEALPFIPQEHSSSNHDAIPPPEAIPPRPSTSGGESNGSQRTRQVPPPSTPPRIPLPLLPSISAKPQSVVPVASTSSQEQPIPQELPPRSAVTVGRNQRSAPNLPPAPTSPPPPPPSIARRSPRSIRSPLPAQFANSPPLPSPPLLSPPPSNNLLLNNAPPLPQPRRRRDSDEGSSIRTLPMTPTPPYVRGAPAPIQVLEPEPTGETPPHSAPPYAPAMPPTSPQAHSILTRTERSGSEAARSLRRLPLPPQ